LSAIWHPEQWVGHCQTLSSKTPLDYGNHWKYSWDPRIRWDFGHPKRFQVISNSSRHYGHKWSLISPSCTTRGTLSDVENASWRQVVRHCDGRMDCRGRWNDVSLPVCKNKWSKDCVPSGSNGSERAQSLLHIHATAFIKSQQDIFLFFSNNGRGGRYAPYGLTIEDDWKEHCDAINGSERRRSVKSSRHMWWILVLWKSS
jgi:hypothetical protein